MRWLSVTIRNGFGAVLGFFALPWCLGLLFSGIEHHPHWPKFPLATCLGFAVGVVLCFVRKPNELLHTFVHECCHALLCVLLRVEFKGMAFFKGRGGRIEYKEPRDRIPLRTLLILIAPYTVPLLLGPVLLARWWWDAGAVGMVLSALCAFLFVTHLQGLVLNVRLNFWGAKADLPRVGRFLALVLIAGVLLLLSAAVVSVLWRGGPARLWPEEPVRPEERTRPAIQPQPVSVPQAVEPSDEALERSVPATPAAAR